jgi:hypothetical protein
VIDSDDVHVRSKRVHPLKADSGTR